MIKDRIVMSLGVMGCVLLGVGIGDLFEDLWTGIALMVMGGSIFTIVLLRYRKHELEASALTTAIIHRALEQHRRTAEQDEQ